MSDTPTPVQPSASSMDALRNMIANSPGSVPFVLYKSDGKIEATGYSPVDMLVYRTDVIGELLLIGDATPETHYVDIKVSPPKIIERPVIDWTFDRTELKPREEAVLSNVPPGIVSFTGPVSGSQEHTEHGDLTIGWTLPGDYTVVVRTFPYRNAIFQLKVLPR